MADEKPLTKSDLIAAFKEIGVATKKDVSDIIHDALAEFFVGRIEPELDELGAKIDQVDQKVSGLSVELAHVKDTVDGLRADLAIVPSRDDFDKLKTRVRRLEIARGDL